MHTTFQSWKTFFRQTVLHTLCNTDKELVCTQRFSPGRPSSDRQCYTLCATQTRSLCAHNISVLEDLLQTDSATHSVQHRQCGSLCAHNVSVLEDLLQTDSATHSVQHRQGACVHTTFQSWKTFFRQTVLHTLCNTDKELVCTQHFSPGRPSSDRQCYTLCATQTRSLCAHNVSVLEDLLQTDSATHSVQHRQGACVHSTFQSWKTFFRQTVLHTLCNTDKELVCTQRFSPGRPSSDRQCYTLCATQTRSLCAHNVSVLEDLLQTDSATHSVQHRQGACVHTTFQSWKTFFRQTVLHTLCNTDKELVCTQRFSPGRPSSDRQCYTLCATQTRSLCAHKDCVNCSLMNILI